MKKTSQIYYRHEDELEDYSSVVKLGIKAGIRKTAVFYYMRIYLLIMIKNSVYLREVDAFLIYQKIKENYI